jgi:cation:H+ antiporter
MNVWLQFTLCVLAIGFAGAKLSVYGDVIADKTHLGGTWIGLILLATVTSLPELATGISSVGIVDVPDIALGDALGSCVFNLLLIAILDLLKRDTSLYSQASRGHILSAGFGVLLIGVVGLNLLLADNGFNVAVGHVGIYAPVIVLLYFVTMRTLFRYESQLLQTAADQQPDQYPLLSLRQVIYRYMMAASVVVAAGIWLPYVAEDLARIMGWKQSFVGTLFVAFVTSLPEMVVTIAALRIGALDMAVGNLLGSNLFNILILAIDDVVYVKGPLLSHVSPSHSSSVFTTMMMSAAVIIGLLYRREHRVLRSVNWPSVVLLILYLTNTFMLYSYQGTH